MKSKRIRPKLRGFYIFTRAHGLHSVYVLHCPGQPYSKVGIADEPHMRLSGVQNGNWMDLELYDHWWTTDMKLSKMVEQGVLKRHAKHRARGEWMKLPPEELAALVESAAADLNVGLMKREDLEPLAEEWHRKGLSKISLTNFLLIEEHGLK